MAPEIKVPEAPAYLPESVQAEWRKRYIEEFKQVEGDPSIAQGDKPILALKGANKMLAVPTVASYEEAQKLKDWQFITREVRGNQLVLVTADAKKYRFAVPAKSK